MAIQGATRVKEHGANAGLDLIEVPDDVLEILGPGEEIEEEPVKVEEPNDDDESPDDEEVRGEEEEADAEEAADAEGSPVLEEKPVSKKDKRIEQIVYERKLAEERAAAAETRREIDRQQIETLRQELEALRKGRYDSDTAHVSEKIEIAKARRKAAVEEADLEAFAEASDSLTELLLQQQRLSEPPEEPKKTDFATPRQDDLHPAAKEWLTRNAWYVDPNQQEKANRAYTIQNELLNQGYGFGRKLYEELDKRLNESEKPVEQKPAESEKKQSSLPPTMGSPTSSDTAPRKPKLKPGELSEYDIQAIKLAQLDPNDPNVRKTYLRYKRKPS